MAKYFFDEADSAPEVVTDEIVKCTKSVTINSTTYYEGWMAGLTDELMAGLGSTYGAWTAASKAGTQYTVIHDGLPTSEQVFIDLNTGRLLTSASVTLYLRYLDYGRIFKWYELGGGDLFHVDGMVTNVAEETLFDLTINFPTRYVAAIFSCENSTDDDLTINVKNVTSGVTGSFTITAGLQKDTIFLSAAVPVQRGDNMTITARANTSNAVNPRIVLIKG